MVINPREVAKLFAADNLIEPSQEKEFADQLKPLYELQEFIKKKHDFSNDVVTEAYVNIHFKNLSKDVPKGDTLEEVIDSIASKIKIFSENEGFPNPEGPKESLKYILTILYKNSEE